MARFGERIIGSFHTDRHVDTEQRVGSLNFTYTPKKRMFLRAIDWQCRTATLGIRDIPRAKCQYLRRGKSLTFELLQNFRTSRRKITRELVIISSYFPANSTVLDNCTHLHTIDSTTSFPCPTFSAFLLLFPSLRSSTSYLETTETVRIPRIAATMAFPFRYRRVNAALDY